MAEDDFTEDFDDDPLPEEFQEEAPKQAQIPRRPAPPAPQRAPRPAPPRQQVQTQAPASAPIQTQQVRFVPFELPTRIGIFDNTTGKPLMEESPRTMDKQDLIIAKLDVVFGAVTELMNKVNELEKNI
jgi:hypothetical protein